MNAPTAVEFGDRVELNLERVRSESCEPQLGILSLAGVAEDSGFPPTIFDLNREFFRYADAVGQDGIEDFAEAAASQIAEIDVEVFGFGSICSGSSICGMLRDAAGRRSRPFRGPPSRPKTVREFAQ